MNPALKGIWQHMRDLGLGALAHANRHAAYAAVENPRWPELAALQATHAAELLIKARIAQEHPLLIFDQLPRSAQAPGALLNLDDLFERGRTVQWSELPDRLWAATGISLPERAQFESFGKFRNGLQHFGPASGHDAGDKTLRFVFSVVDPLINQCWELFAIDYDEDDEPYVYFAPTLVAREIPFLVSSEAAESLKHWDVDWSAVSEGYRTLMMDRLRAAG